AIAFAGALVFASCASQGAAVDEFSGQAAELYPASYRPFQSSYTVNARYGDILNAARGLAPDGRRVLAMLVRGSARYDSAGSRDMGYASQIPNPYRILIVIDESTDHVVASRIVRDGTTQGQFTTPEEKLAAYQEVVINSETAFDGFTGGLVTGKQFDVETDIYGVEVITGTSLIYTGATVQGTFSSQLIRNCFMTAARFYVNNKQA
ncbi:MAG: hypothetical protein LBK64_04630, partial [Spirochaetaceae bacterium]|nr:hypothetical protein [Spirochaetaceae bacterium]